MQNMNIAEWYEETVGADSVHTIAVNAGVTPSSLYRQLPDKISPENVVKIARAYSVSAINGLVALGLLDDSDISKLRTSDALRDATDQELLDELARRLAAAQSNPIWSAPIVVEDDKKKRVEEAKRRVIAKDQRLAAYEIDNKQNYLDHGMGDDPA